VHVVGFTTSIVIDYDARSYKRQICEIFRAVQTVPEGHPTSCTMGTGSFLRVKWPGRGADQSSLSRPGCEWVGAIPLPPLCYGPGLSWGDLHVYILRHSEDSTGLNVPKS
jgi:hypothetical protein